jgi:hypothetical protein
MNDRTNFFVDWGALAQSKGRSGLVWVLLSLLVGRIATFLIVVLGRVPADLE